MATPEEGEWRRQQRREGVRPERDLVGQVRALEDTTEQAVLRISPDRCSGETTRAPYFGVHRTGLPFRLLTVLLTAIHLAVGVVVPFADARVEAAAGVVRAHTEAPGSHHGPPIHASDCALCQHVVIAFARPGRPAIPVGRVVQVASASRVRERASQRDVVPTALPRAPPNA
jgi:hypothetical protein